MNCPLPRVAFVHSADVIHRSWKWLPHIAATQRQRHMMEPDSLFDLLHISFNLSTCASDYGIKKMEITFICGVLTDCQSHLYCNIQPPTTQTDLDCFSSLLILKHWMMKRHSGCYLNKMHFRPVVLLPCAHLLTRFHDLCSIYCIKIIWICKGSPRQHSWHSGPLCP